jgi:hypothetical protein
MHPSYCFRGTTATHRRRRGILAASRSPCRGHPQTRCPLSCTRRIRWNLIRAHYSCRRASPVGHRESKSHLRLRLPALYRDAQAPRGLSLAFASDFLGRGRLLPLSGFNTTTTPCLRAAMGDVHHVVRLSLLGRSRSTFQPDSVVPNLPAQALLIQFPEPSGSSTSDSVSRTMMLKTSSPVTRTIMLKTFRRSYPTPVPSGAGAIRNMRSSDPIAGVAPPVPRIR